MIRLFILTVVLSFSVGIAKNNQAVMLVELSGRGIDSTSAQILTDKLRSEIIKVGKIPLVERDKLLTVLKEQGLQQTGITNQDNIIKIGNILNANRAIVGEVGKLNGLDFIAIRLLDIQTGKNIVSFDKTYNDFSEFLKIGISELAKDISLSPKDWATLGDNKYEMNDFQSAITNYEIAMAYIANTDNSIYLESCSKDPFCSYSDSYSRMCRNLADSYSKIGKTDDAIMILKKDIEQFPLGLLSYLMLGSIYFSQDRYLDAESEYMAVVLLKKQYQNLHVYTAFYNAYFKLGLIHYWDDLAENAVQDFTNALTIRNDSETLLMRAKAYLKLNKKQLCISDLKKCVLDTSSTSASISLQAKNMLDSLNLK